MKREEVIALCRRARDIGMVRHEDYCDFVVPMEKRRRQGDEWTTVETAYMSVDGKLAMANEDHRQQGKRLDFENPIVLVDNEEQLTLQISVVSEVYGRRHGIATSRRNGSSPVERQFPWEVAETSAIGRALGSMGYGLIPGAGLTSAEDAARALEREPEASAGAPSTPKPVRKPASRLTPTQKTKLVELYSELHETDGAGAQRGVESTFAQRFGHSAEQGTYDEGALLIGQLMKEQRAKMSPDAKPEPARAAAANKPPEKS